jgi:hypothetical protein
MVKAFSVRSGDWFGGCLGQGATYIKRELRKERPMVKKPTPKEPPVPDNPIPPMPEPGPDLPPAAQRALAEAAARREAARNLELPPELGGRDGPEPVRYGDWEKKGIAIDF